MKRKRGRPAKFESVEELSDRIDQYFKTGTKNEIYCFKKGKAPELITVDAPTVSGLALFLGFNSRKTLYNYRKREPFSNVMSRAVLRIEMHYEQQLSIAKNPRGAIFMLKNFGWSDRPNSKLSKIMGSNHPSPTVLFL